MEIEIIPLILNIENEGEITKQMGQESWLILVMREEKWKIFGTYIELIFLKHVYLQRKIQQKLILAQKDVFKKNISIATIKDLATLKTKCFGT